MPESKLVEGEPHDVARGEAELPGDVAEAVRQITRPPA
jgi:hypothetical protein